MYPRPTKASGNEPHATADLTDHGGDDYRHVVAVVNKNAIRKKEIMIISNLDIANFFDACIADAVDSNIC